MTATEVRDQVRLALARVLNGDALGDEDVRPFPVYGNTVRVYRHIVLNSGPLQATTNRGADKFGAYTGVSLASATLGDLTGIKDFQRAYRSVQNNAFEGVYIDDIIIGFAERGEQVVYEPDQQPPVVTNYFESTPFYEHIGGPFGFTYTQTETGTYQLEIRAGAEYGDNIYPFLSP